MHTTRYARESHTRAYLANDNDCSNFYPPRASTIHHPLASPTPRSHRASALGPLCMLTCSSDVPRRKVGAWEFGHAQFGAVLLGPMCAALSSDVLPFGRRGSTGTQRYRLLLICLLPGPMCHRPSSDVSRRKVGSWEYGCTTVPFASPPVFAGPPFVCS